MSASLLCPSGNHSVPFGLSEEEQYGTWGWQLPTRRQEEMNIPETSPGVLKRKDCLPPDHLMSPVKLPESN